MDQDHRFVNVQILNRSAIFLEGWWLWGPNLLDNEQSSLPFLLSSLPPHLLFIYSTTTSRASVIILGKHRGLECKRGLTDTISLQRNLKHPWIQSASIFWLSTMLKCCVEVKKRRKCVQYPEGTFGLEGDLPSCLSSILVVLLFYCVFPLLPVNVPASVLSSRWWRFLQWHQALISLFSSSRGCTQMPRSHSKGWDWRQCGLGWFHKNLTRGSKIRIEFIWNTSFPRDLQIHWATYLLLIAFHCPASLKSYWTLKIEALKLQTRLSSKQPIWNHIKIFH